MKAFLLPATVILLLLSFQVSAQDSSEHIETIRVVKKPVNRPLPDTGRYNSPASYVPDGAIRGWEEWRCGYRPEHGALFAGVQYFKYTFVQVGVEKINDHFPMITGVTLEGNVDKNIYGASVFAQQPVCYPLGIKLSAGASANAYTTPGKMLYAAAPYISFNFPYKYLTRIRLSYGYNLLFDAQRTTNDADGSLKGVNTHFIALTWHLPYY